MKSAIIALVVYFSGAICAYLYCKKTTIKFHRYMNATTAYYPGEKVIEWSTKDRKTALIMSAGSWLSILTVAISPVHYNPSEPVKANW